jgi:hypothetical protein
MFCCQVPFANSDGLGPQIRQENTEFVTSVPQFMRILVILGQHARPTLAPRTHGEAPRGVRQNALVLGTLLAPGAHSSMLTDATASALLAPGALTAMLTEATASALLAL